ncbi:MAG TPA: DUF222 domain-containing protein [Streptosporangiaceae bacterium]|nr:DUF222 domain-containing protein [Streptosporangiaceae bacterium]
MAGACAADVREELLARVWAPTIRAASRQDDELAAELEALEAAGGLVPAGAGELCDLPPDLDCGPPDGADAWLADLPAELLAEYLAATQPSPCREPIVAGRLPRRQGDGCGFAAGGAADEMPPGAVLAGFAGDAWAAGLGRLRDDELIGVLRAARRLASWSAALELAAVADLAARREADAEAAGVCAPGEHIADEIAAALTLTGRAADALVDLGVALRRLPATMTALAAGEIDRCKAAVIADEAAGLSADHAGAVERQVLRHAPGQTTGQLRAATRRAVLTADPGAARERKERARCDARVERWHEHAGTAALAGRDLPPAEVLAADHNLSALAGSLRRAGVSGTMDQLRAKAYLALLTGQPLAALTGPGGADDGPGTRAPGPIGSVNLTMPLATWLGLSEDPGHATGHGPLDAGDSRDLAALLARQPGSRWCITVTGEDGRPVAHGCARTGPRPTGGSRPPPADRASPRSAPGRSRPPPPNGTSSRPVPNGTVSPPRKGASPGLASRGSRLSTRRPARASRQSTRRPARASDPGLPAGVPGLPTGVLDWLAGIAVRKLETGDCSHMRESPGYRPSSVLRHLITIRQPTCSFPGCRRPAARCDQDHTVPCDQGGRTCECNLGPLCRRHHHAKQAHGWRLTQPEPGVLIWTTPSGRVYSTHPAKYHG